MFDAELFIELVKDSPCLWDQTLAGYSDRSERDGAWRAICEEFVADWEVLDSKQRDTKEKDLKFKWRNIRDSFLRSIKTGKSGDPAAKKKKYVYSDRLTFLLSLQKGRRAGSDITEPSSSEPAVETQEDTSCCTRDDASLPDTGGGEAPLTSQRAPGHRRKGPVEAALLQQLDTNPTTAEDDQDADRLFLLSLLPQLRSLQEDDRFDFKISTLQLMRFLKRKQSQSPSYQYDLAVPGASSAPEHYGPA